MGCRGAHISRYQACFFVVAFLLLPMLSLGAEQEQTSGGTNSFQLQQQTVQSNEEVIPGNNSAGSERYGVIAYEPQNPSVGDSVEFRFIQRAGCPLGPNLFEWNFPDHSITTRDQYTRVSYTFTKPGQYTITTYYTAEECGAYHRFIDDVVITIPVKNEIRTWPVKPMIGGKIQFSVSNDNSSEPKTWYFGDGSSVTTSNPDVEHMYTRTGVYQVRVEKNGKEFASRSLDLTLQKGDIFVHASTGFFPKIIPGAWSHAAMYIGKNANSGEDEVIEAVGPGVRKHYLKDYWFYPQDTTVAVFRITGLSEQKKKDIVNFALSKDERLYDFLSLTVWQKQRDCSEFPIPPFLSWVFRCRSYYCSELVWAAFKDNGVNLYPSLGLVLPGSLVTATEVKNTVLVGCHIEKIPDSAKQYTPYFNEILQGDNPPYKNRWKPVGAEPNLLLSGLADPNGTGIVSMKLTDPIGINLSDNDQIMSNASINRVDAYGKGVNDSEIMGIAGPASGQYMMHLETNQSSAKEVSYLQVTAGNFENYTALEPIRLNTSLGRPVSVPFFVQTNNREMVIAIPNKGKAPLTVQCIGLVLNQSMHTTWKLCEDCEPVNNLSNVTEVFTEPGNYSVMMAAWDGINSTNVTVPIIVEEPDLPLQANFTAEPVSGIPPLGVQFTDKSDGSPNRWNWTFGDGSVSHEQNPFHTYRGIGKFTVTLDVSKKTGEQSVIRKPASITTNSGRMTGPMGMIWISSSPSGAEVSVDGVAVGTTPLQSSGIPVGYRQVRVSMDGYQNWTGIVQVSQGTFSYVPKVVLQKTQLPTESPGCSTCN